MSQKKHNEKSFRRIQEMPDIANMRDYLEFSMTVNKEKKDMRETFLSNSPPRLSNRGAYNDPSDATMSPEKHIRDINGSPLLYNAKEIQVKPKLIESSMAAHPNFMGLPDGFKRIFAEDTKD